MAVIWTVARNASGRPTLQHAVESTSDVYTACGWPISGWSRVYTERPVTIIACKRCAHATGTSLARTGSRLALVS